MFYNLCNIKLPGRLEVNVIHKFPWSCFIKQHLICVNSTYFTFKKIKMCGVLFRLLTFQISIKKHRNLKIYFLCWLSRRKILLPHSYLTAAVESKFHNLPQVSLVKRSAVTIPYSSLCFIHINPWSLKIHLFMSLFYTCYPYFLKLLLSSLHNHLSSFYLVKSWVSVPSISSYKHLIHPDRVMISLITLVIWIHPYHGPFHKFRLRYM